MNKPVQTIDQAGNGIVEASPMAQFNDQLLSMEEKLRASLPAHISVDRFMRVVMVAIQTSPTLLMADRHSLLLACTKAAMDGLLPDGREGALAPFKTKVQRRNPNGGVAEIYIQAVQWMPMVAGIRKKIRNSGEVNDLKSRVVYEKDAFEVEYGDHEKILHRPYKGTDDPGQIVAAYSIAHLKNGEVSREIMWRREIDRVRAVSKSPDSPAWKNWFDEMARKCVIRRHAKSLPQNTDLDLLLEREKEFFEPTSAIEQEKAPPRPSLSQFMETKLPDHIAETGELVETETGDEQPAGEPEKTAKADSPKAADKPAPKETASPEQEELLPEFGQKEAFDLGTAARKSRKPMSPPPDLEEQFHDAFVAGWKEQDEQARPKK